MLNNAKAVLSRRIEQMPEEGLLMLLEETFPYVRRHASLLMAMSFALAITALSANTLIVYWRAVTLEALACA